MADAALSFLLHNLKEVLSNQIHLLSDEQNELQQLNDELGLMKAFLEAASNKVKKEKPFRELERQIRDVVYYAEDIIESCITQAAIGKAKSIVHRYLNPKRHNLAQGVKTLRENRVKPVFDKIAAFANLDIGPSDAIDQEARDTREKVPRQENVVGFELEKEKLIGYLIEESKEIKVISIIGMPGIGKTTLAWNIYRDPIIHAEFPKVIWIYVSQEFNKRDIFLTILMNHTDEEMHNKTISELTKLVRNYLEGEKFLIFMDDVWNVEALNEIQDALPESNNTGKILITSRHEQVAWKANLITSAPNRVTHKLRFLNYNESWELLKLEVFGKFGDCPKHLENVGKQIVQLCEGHPLAIVVMGGILVQKYSTPGGDIALRKEWTKVYDSVRYYPNQDDREERLKKIISLSYTNLPYDMRDCFLYLGIFPNDIEIPVRKLIQLWIAEGFIQHKSGKSLEEIAEDNLKELTDRNLVIVGKTKPDGEVKTCRVHSTIREFCKNEAAVENQNIFSEVRMSNDGVFEEIQKYRRICIHSCVDEFLLKKPKVPNARSFLGSSRPPINLENKNIPSIADAFNLLRILDANTIRLPKFPAKLTKLVLLRYVTLSGDKFKVLPKSISRLWNLQTLIVDTPSDTLVIKANIWKMMHLKHLTTNASIILKKYGKGKGEKLCTLTKLSPESCTKKVFNKARNLKTLGIRGKLDSLSDSNCLEILDHLDKLKLVHDVFGKIPLGIPLEGLPRTFPPNLKILTLSGTHLDWSHMSTTLGKLGSLEVLKLKDNAFDGYFWDAVGGGFHRLELLYIEHTNLEIWTSSDDPFPKLTGLVLKNCQKLQLVPIDLVKKLEMLSMEGVTKHAVTSAKKMELLIQRAEGKRTTERGGFKLIIAPDDESNHLMKLLSPT